MVGSRGASAGASARGAAADAAGGVGGNASAAGSVAKSAMPDRAQGPSGKEGKKVTSLHVPDVRALVDDEEWLMGTFMTEKSIPSYLSFPLLAATRRARAFVAGRAARIEQVRIRILAISCLSLYHPAPQDVSNLFAHDSELVADAVALAKADVDEGLGDLPDSLRVLAVRFLSTVCPDRHRFSQLLTSAGVASHHGALPSLLRAQMRFLALDAATHVEKNSNSSGGVATGSSSLSADAKPAALPAQSAGVAESRAVSLLLAENVVGLVHNIATCTSGPGATGATALVSSGAFVAMIPLLADRNPAHTRVVSVAIRAMECIIESTHATAGGAVFRNHRGVSLVVDRVVGEVGLPVKSGDSAPAVASGSRSVPLATPSVETGAAEMDEVSTGGAAARDSPVVPSVKSKKKTARSPLEEEDDSVERSALAVRGETRGFYELLGRRQLTPAEALKHPAPSSSVASRGQLPHSTFTLLRGLMRLLLLGMGTDTTSFREVASSDFPQALRRVVARPFHYGGSLFATAASTAADIAHAEPVVTSALVDAGILRALLRSVGMGLPPSGEAIRCVPNVLAALSLAPAARDEIIGVQPLRPYVARLATPFYGRAMHGETPVLIGSSLDELIRHVESLRSEGGKAMLEFLKLASVFVKAPTPAELLDGTLAPDGTETKPSGPVSAGEPGASTLDKAGSALLESGVESGKKDALKKDGSGSMSPSNEAKEKLLQLDKMRLTVANNAARLASSAQTSSEQQSTIIRLNGLQHMFDLRYAPAHAVASLNKDVPTLSASRSAATPHNTIHSLIAAFRSLCSRHGPAVLKATFEVVKKDAALALDIGAQLDGAWLEDEEVLVGTTHEQESGENATKSVSEDATAIKAVESGVDGVKQRKVLRKKLHAAVCRLRVDVIILTGLSRSGPGSVGTWDAATGSQVAAIIASVERAARWHIARVYTGLALESTNYGGREENLCGGSVTASAESALKPMESGLALDLARRIGKLVNCTRLEMSEIAMAAKKIRVPPGANDLMRQEVTGIGWALVTFVVSAQTLYSTLSHGLMYNVRRYAREPGMFGSSLGAIASAVGRIFALHLKAAESLWDQKVITAGNGEIPAAWDYLRGILIEMRGCFFDDSRPYDGASRTMTQPLILKSFLAAGGGEALLSVCRPASLASTSFADSEESSGLSNSTLYDYLCRVAEEHCSMPTQGVAPALSVGAVVASTRDVVKKLHDKAANSDAEMLSPNSSGGSRSPPPSALRKWFIGTDSEKMDAALSALASEVLDENRKNAVRASSLDTWSMLVAFVRLLGSCPALSLDSPLPSITGHSSSGQDAIGSTESWTARDLRRSSQALAISLVRNMLSGPNSDGVEHKSLSPSVVSRILSFVQTVSTSSAQLTEPDPSTPSAAPSGAASRREIINRARGVRTAVRGRGGGAAGGADRGYFVDPYLGGGVLIDDPQFGRPGYYPPGVDPEDPDLVLRNPSEEVPFERIWITREQHEEILAGMAPDEVPAIPGFLGGRNRSAPEAPRVVDPAHVAILAEMGFPESQARVALRRIRTGGVNEAAEWLLMNPDGVGDEDDGEDNEDNDDDDEAGDDEDEDDNDEDDADEGLEAQMEDGRDGNVEASGDQEENESLGQASASMDVQADQGDREANSIGAAASGPDDSAAGGDRAGGDRESGEDAMHDSSAAGTPSDRIMTEVAGAGSASAGGNEGEEEGESEGQAPISALTRALGALPVPVPVHPSGSSNDSILPGGPPKSKSEGRPGGEETSPVGVDEARADHLTAFGGVASSDENSSPIGLLQGAAKAERGDLVSALGKFLSSKESGDVLSQCETLIGDAVLPIAAEVSGVPSADRVVPTGTPARSTSSSAVAGRRRLEPVWKEDYLAAKRGLFVELVPFTRRALRGAASGSPKVDSSALAVDLLLAMEKDGFMSKASRSEYAELLTAGFKTGQSAASNSDSGDSDALMHACALWTHHGGLAVRHALASCGVGERAVEVLESCILSWDSLAAAKPSFDEDTVKPIENLTIHDGHGKSTAAGGDDMSHVRLRLTAVAMKELPSYVKRVTSCLLLLDAFVHFRDDDALLVRCATPAEAVDVPEKKADVPGPRGKGTAGGSSGQDAVEPAGVVDGSSKVEMQVDQLPNEVSVELDCEEEDMMKARLNCSAAIDGEMSSITKDLSSWLFPLPLTLTGPIRADCKDTIPYSRAMHICLQLLDVWAGMDAGDAFTALLQLISSLTLIPEMAQHFLDGGGVETLLTLRNLGTRAGSSTEPRLVREFVKTIVRHVVEDPLTLREGMESDLRTSFSHPYAGPNGPRAPRRTVPALLDMYRNMIQRNPVVFVHALSKVAKLVPDSGESRASSCLLGVLTVEEMNLRKGGGRIVESEIGNRCNIKTVMDGLVSRLVTKSGNRRRSMSGKLPKSSPESSPTTKAVGSLGASSDPTSSGGDSASRDTIVFALQAISELVNVFPACIVSFLQCRGPGADRVDSSALDYVVEFLLPALSKSGILPPVGNAMAASSAARELMNSLCRRSAGAYQHVVDALAKAASYELERQPDVRPGAVSQFAHFVAHCRRPCVLLAFLSSGIADSLTQSLDKMDLNADGMGDVIFLVLSALEAMGKVSVTLQQQNAKDRKLTDDEIDRIPLTPSPGHRPWGMARRSALFETLAQNTLDVAAFPGYGSGVVYPADPYADPMDDEMGL